MDISRFFHLAYQASVNSPSGETLHPDFHYLIMTSLYSGEFGSVKCTCIAQIEPPFDFKFYFNETSGESNENLYFIRQDSIRFFNQHILPLFNPKTFIKDALPFTEKEV